MTRLPTCEMQPTPLTWFVVTTVPDADGNEKALFGRASYDGDGDLLTVSTLTACGRTVEATQVGGHPMHGLAKMLLREMFRKEG